MFPKLQALKTVGSPVPCSPQKVNTISGRLPVYLNHFAWTACRNSLKQTTSTQI